MREGSTEEDLCNYNLGVSVASHRGWKCGPGSRGADAIRVLSLLLVFSFAPRGFFSGFSDFPLSSKTSISF